MEKGWVGSILTEPDGLTEPGTGHFLSRSFVVGVTSVLPCHGLCPPWSVLVTGCFPWMFPTIRQFHGLPCKQSQGLFVVLDFIDLCLL